MACKKLKGNIIIASGGTGGHVFPAVCLADELEKRGYRVVFATDKRGLKYLGKYQQDAVVQNIKTSSRKILYLSLVFNVILSVFKILTIRPKIVIGFGGYPSVPFVLASQFLKIKTVIHEQNAIFGKANLLLAKMASKIATGFPDTKGFRNKIKYVGNPTRYEEQYNSVEFPQNEIFSILVFGGSQGAKIFAEDVVRAICNVSSQDRIKVVHQVRQDDVEKVKEIYSKHNIDFTVKSFFNEIDDLYKSSDIVISRAGASTISELIGFKKPAILIPYGKSINGDQSENAKYLEENDAAIVISEKNLTEDLLTATLGYLMRNKQRRLELFENLKRLRVTDSVKKFADIIDETIYN